MFILTHCLYSTVCMNKLVVFCCPFSLFSLLFIFYICFVPWTPEKIYSFVCFLSFFFFLFFSCHFHIRYILPQTFKSHCMWVHHLSVWLRKFPAKFVDFSTTIYISLSHTQTYTHTNTHSLYYNSLKNFTTQSRFLAASFYLSWNDMRKNF